MHVSRSHMRFWARNPNTSNGRTVSAESSEIQRHRWVKTNNNNNLSTSAFFSNLLHPKAPKRSVGINGRAGGANSLLQTTRTACGAHRSVVHRNSFALHRSSSVYQWGLPATPCILHAPAACVRSGLRLYFGERLWWKIKRGILKVSS